MKRTALGVLDDCGVGNLAATMVTHFSCPKVCTEPKTFSNVSKNRLKYGKFPAPPSEVFV